MADTLYNKNAAFQTQGFNAIAPSGPLSSAQQVANTMSATGYTAPVNSAPAISPMMDAGSLQTGSPSLSLQPPQKPTDYSATLSAIPTVDSIVNTATQTPEATQLKNSQSTLERLMTSLTGRTADQQKAEQASGATDYSKQLNDLNSQITSLKNEATAIPLQDQNNAQGRGITAGGLAPITQAQVRTNAIKALTLNSLAETIKGNLANAQAQADKAVALIYDPIEQQIKVAQQQITDNMPFFTAAEKKQADLQTAKLAERSRQLDAQKEDKKTILGFAAEAAKNGAPTLIVQQATQLDDPQQALATLSQYMSDPNDKEKALADIAQTRAQTNAINATIAKTNAETAKTKAETAGLGIPSVTNPQAGQYKGALDVILGSAKFTKDQKTAVVNAVNNGQDPFSVIKNQAKNIMGQTEATKVTNFEVAKSQVQDLSSLLKDYYAQGGKTNLLSGSYEKVLNNLGQVNDPKLVSLATQISSALQIYRNAVSGTAYSEQEGKDIASIFPGINKTQGLNDAILAGRLKAFDSTIDGSYRSALGSTYDDLKNAQNTPVTSTVVPATQVPAGYYQASDGLFYKK